MPVGVNPADFLSRRTAVLGMTRTGKSNTVKTTAAAVKLAGDSAGVRIGQAIFDINGEYANANGQDDGSSLAEVFQADTIRYRGIETAGFQDLRNNFFESPGIGLSIIQSLLRDQWAGRAGDMSVFLNGGQTNRIHKRCEESSNAGGDTLPHFRRFSIERIRSNRPFTVRFTASQQVRDLSGSEQGARSLIRHVAYRWKMP